MSTPPEVFFIIREQDPLKQGLKLNYFAATLGHFTIREQDPLKQGLKHIDITIFNFEYYIFVSKIH